MRLLSLIAAALILPDWALAYSFEVEPTGPVLHPHWHANASLTFTLGAEPPANMKTGTDMQAALQAGLDAWRASSGISMEITLSTRTDLEAVHDGLNALTFADTATNRDVVGEAHAMTLTWWEDGVMTEADIVFRTDQVTWGDADEDDSVIDLQGLTAHECGHVLGLEHTAIQSATMFPWGGPGQTWRRALAPDDVAGAAWLYGRLESTTGSIVGTTRANGQGVFMVHVVAERDGIPVASAITLQDGQYSVHGLAPGTYRLYAEPLDGPMVGANLSGGAWEQGGNTPVYNATEANNGHPLNVVSNGDVGMDILLDTTSTGPNLRFIMPSADGSSFSGRGPWALPLEPGGQGYMALVGHGVDRVPDARFLASRSVTFTAVSSRGINSDGIAFAILRYRVDQDAPPGGCTVSVTNEQGVMAVLTGGIIIPGTSQPVIPDAGTTGSSSGPITDDSSSGSEMQGEDDDDTTTGGGDSCGCSTSSFSGMFFLWLLGAAGLASMRSKRNHSLP